LVADPVAELVLSRAEKYSLRLPPFALMVAASRVVLGLHYPTDVLAGALLGALIAQGSNWLF
jgi:undecaprenyl-diphosphatase